MSAAPTRKAWSSSHSSSADADASLVLRTQRADHVHDGETIAEREIRGRCVQRLDRLAIAQENHLSADLLGTPEDPGYVLLGYRLGPVDNPEPRLRTGRARTPGRLHVARIGE